MQSPSFLSKARLCASLYPLSERRKVGSFLWTKEERTNERRRAKLSEEKFFTWKATKNINARSGGKEAKVGMLLETQL